MIPFLCQTTAQKMKFPVKDFFSKCDQMENFMENFIFCAVGINWAH